MPWYLAVRSDSALDTIGLLSRTCTRPILNMVRQAPSICNNLLSSMYAEVYRMEYIPMYTNHTSYNNNIIIWFQLLVQY